ncbi:MAG: S8 family serine peptidase [Thermoplasmatota archaeon]
MSRSHARLVLAALLLAAGLPLSSLPHVPTPFGAARAASFSHSRLGLPDSEVVVAVIDTGIDPHSPEFAGYVGDGHANPQIVAWWDFGADGPAPSGATWDPKHPVPYDNVGHGTATAALVGGRTVGADPGVKLAIAKIEANGSLVNITDAIAWARETVGANVISMSFGTIAPVPGGANFDENAQIQSNHDAGVVSVVAAGNGLLDYGIKYPSEFDAPAGSPYAIAVGATDRTHDAAGPVNAYFSNTDPDVVAWGVAACSARAHNATGAYTGTMTPDASCHSGSSDYGIADGTSFSAPLVAGWAASLVQAAIGNGTDASPGHIAQLLEYTAQPGPAPYAAEGFGWVNGATAATALPYAASGASPRARAHAPHAQSNTRSGWGCVTRGPMPVASSKSQSPVPSHP